MSAPWQNYTTALEAEGKVVVREARLIRICGGWDETTARLFAADCAEHVLPTFERDCCPGDDRPRKAIAAARALARVSRDNIKAWADAGAAAAAAGAAAGKAAREAGGKYGPCAAMAAARAATTGAAWGAAWGAARSAACYGLAEREWQSKRLLGYLHALRGPSRGWWHD